MRVTDSRAGIVSLGKNLNRIGSRCQDGGNHPFSWVLNVRGYFSDENFVYAGYGQGALLIDNPTASDLLAGRGRIYLAGVTWYIWQKVRIEALFSRTIESSLARSTFQITAGYRWR